MKIHKKILTIKCPGCALSSLIFLAALMDYSNSAQAQEFVLIPTNAIWKFLDNGSDLGTAWQSIDFVDTSWSSGRAQLGYGDGDEATVVSFGPEETNKYVTTHFRRDIKLTNPRAITGLSLRLLRDDGAVVYLNGTEVFRSNMPDGLVAFDTLATSTISLAEESVYHFSSLDPGLLVSGTNVVASRFIKAH